MNELRRKAFQAAGFALLNLSEGKGVEIAGQEFTPEDLAAVWKGLDALIPSLSGFLGGAAAALVTDAERANGGGVAGAATREGWARDRVFVGYPDGSLEEGAGPVEHIEEPCREHKEALRQEAEVRAVLEEDLAGTALHAMTRPLGKMVEGLVQTNRDLIGQNERWLGLLVQMVAAQGDRAENLLREILELGRERGDG